MKIVECAPDSLRANPWNTNHVDPENEEKLTASLSRMGWIRPVICRELEDGALQILGGEHRVRAAGRLGWQVPVVNLGRISDQKAKEIGLLDNARYGSDDAIELAELIQELGNTEELTAFLPFTDADIAQIFASVDIALDDLDTDPLDDEEPKSSDKKPPKTHTMMRFKVPIEDAESVSEVLTRVMKAQGFTASDSLTNAGDALTYVVKLAEQEGLV